MLFCKHNSEFPPSSPTERLRQVLTPLSYAGPARFGIGIGVILPSITLFLLLKKRVQRRAERKSNRIVTSFFIENRLQYSNFAAEQQNEMIVKYAQKKNGLFCRQSGFHYLCKHIQ